MTKVRTAVTSTVGPIILVSKIPVLTPSVVDAILVSSFICRTVSTTTKTSTAASALGTLAAWRSIAVGASKRGLGR